MARTRWIGYAVMGVLLALVPAAAQARPIVLAWDASTDTAVTGYTLLYGTQPGTYTLSVNVGNVTTYQIDLPGVQYYFAIRAYTATGATSAPSNEVAESSAIALTSPGNQSSSVGSIVSLPLVTTGTTTSYTATNLPGGLSFNSSTGLIAGTVSSAALSGSPYLVSASASNGSGNTSSVQFTWTITPPTVPAGMLTPLPGARLGSSATFTWTSGTGLTQIWLDVGTTLGGTQLYSATQGAGTSRTVIGLPFTNAPIYVRLWSLSGSGWSSTDYTYMSAVPVPAGMLTPAPNTVLTASPTTFTWTAGIGVTQIWLDVGTSLGGAQIYGATQGTNQSAAVTNLPTTGAAVYVRLWSLMSIGWAYTDYTYTLPSVTPAAMILPVTGATLPGAATTFSWTPGSSVSQVWLDLGTAPGGANLYSSTQGTSLAVTVSGLPENGSPIFARLWSIAGGAWSSIDYTYRASDPTIANMTSLVSGATFTGSPMTFTWTVPTGVSQIWLDLGSTVGGNQIYAGTQGTNSSRTIPVPTNGGVVYLRLWTLRDGAWQFIDYVYNAVAWVPVGMIAPAAGSTLHGSTNTFTWTPGTGVSQIWLDVGTTTGGNQIYAASEGTGTSQTVTGIPTTGSTLYVRLWSLVGGAWSYTDYTYTTGP